MNETNFFACPWASFRLRNWGNISEIPSWAMEASQKLLEVERWSPGGQNLPSATFKLSSVATDGGDHHERS